MAKAKYKVRRKRAGGYVVVNKKTRQLVSQPGLKRNAQRTARSLNGKAKRLKPR